MITSNNDICYHDKKPIYKSIDNVIKIKTYIFRGNDRANNRLCIKIYEPFDSSIQIPGSYLYEASILEFLQDKDPAFLKFYGSFTENNRFHIIVESVFPSINSLIESLRGKNKELDRVDLLIMMKELVQSMITLKNYGIYHNCINTFNIMLSNGKPKLIDFSNIIVNHTSGVGVYQNLYNSKDYLPPEVNSQKGPPYKYDAEKSDVYALGLCFFELFTLEDVSKLKTEESKDNIEDILNAKPNSSVKRIIKWMLTADEQSRPTWQQIFNLFSIEKLKYPIGQIRSCSSLKFLNKISDYNIGNIDYLANLNTEKVVVSVYDLFNAEQKTFSEYYASSLSEVSEKLPCFLKFIAAFEEENKRYVVIENYGQSLSSIIDNRSVLKIEFTENELKACFKSLLSGLKYCFDNNIYHNNIQSSTLFIQDSGIYKFNSFGPPYFSEGTSGFCTLLKSQFKKNEPLISTPPEVYTGKSDGGVNYVKPKADIYALGLVFYEMVIVMRNLEDNSTENAQKIYNSLTELRTSWIVSLLQGMLKVNPNERLSIDRLLLIIPE